MNEILEPFESWVAEAVKLRLRFDDSGEFKKALLELLDKAKLQTIYKEGTNDEKRNLGKI